MARSTRASDGPEGARTPAPADPPATAPDSEALLGSSRLRVDEPIAHKAVDAALAAGASYADARLVLWKREWISVRDDHVSGVRRSEEYGIGIRVIADGAWGFAAAAAPDAKSAAVLARRAVATAKAHADTLRQPVTLAPTTAVKGVWVAPHRVDPFAVSAAQKAEELIAASRVALAVPGVAFSSASVNSVREEKLFVSSEGTRTHQLYFRIMPSLSATAVDRRRGEFSSRNYEVPPMLAGWEHVSAQPWESDAQVVGQQAVQKLHAKSVEPGRRRVILAPSNLWLTIHESIGHPTELDRAVGLEANYAGTSFLTVEKTGKLALGSDIVNLVADRTQPGGLATTRWDDDGEPAQRWDIVRDGTFVGWQTTRDQAEWIGEARGRGCSYGDSYGSVAFQRMPNISLQPGAEGYTTEDLINATEDGILITGRGSWSIDHQRYNFQFSGQMFWEIENGRVARPLRDVAYQANTVEFWNSCDMIAGAGAYRLGGSFTDGKGEPGQSNGVSHGCPPARFEVNVVNTGGDK
jgi:TldD protein